MSSFSCPILSVSEITESLNEFPISPENLSKPTPDFVCAVYSHILDRLHPHGFDPYQVDFSMLERIDNPDNHHQAISMLRIFRSMRSLLKAIHAPDINFRDILSPDPTRTLEILSAVVNFMLYMDEKVQMLQPVVDGIGSIEDQCDANKKRIAELNEEIVSYEKASEMELPIVRELEVGISELTQGIQNSNKEHMLVKNEAFVLKKGIEELDNEISQVDLEMAFNSQEKADLASKIVQSPDKIQRTLVEKKAYRTEIMNSEKAAMSSFKECSTKHEVLSNACIKVSRHLEKMKVVQEQVNSTKGLEKAIKSLNAKLSDDELVMKSLESQIAEAQPKEKHALELLNAMEKERNLKMNEQNNYLDRVKSELEVRIHSLEQRKSTIEATKATGEKAKEEAIIVREVGKAQVHKLVSAIEAVVEKYSEHSDSLSNWENSKLT